MFSNMYVCTHLWMNVTCSTTKKVNLHFSNEIAMTDFRNYVFIIFHPIPLYAVDKIVKTVYCISLVNCQSFLQLILAHLGPLYFIATAGLRPLQQS